MATYTVKAPDGKTVTLSGPDGASQADIIAQAQALYKPQAAPPTKAARPSTAPNQYLDRYNSIRNGLAAGETDPQKRQIALNRFDSDPRAQQLRKAAGLAPLSTAKQEVQAVAKKGFLSGVSDFVGATEAGAEKSLFGIPERLSAAIHYYLPQDKNEEQFTGVKVPRGKTYAEQLAIERDINAKQRARSLTGNIIGQVMGGGVGLGVGGRVIQAGAGRLAATGAPVLAKTGNILQRLGTLRKGAKLANTGKIIVTGAAASGAQAAGEGENPLVGAAEGAVAAPLMALGFKGAQVVSRPFRDVLRMTSADRFLRRLTNATKDQLEAKAATYRAATGAEPTLFELLPLADRNKILKSAVVGKDDVVERASGAIRARAKNLGPEMSRRAQQILQPNRTKIQAKITQDIADARGGQLAPGDDEMIANAMDNPIDMRRLRKAEANAIMAPHEATPVAPNLEDLFPHVPGPNGTRVEVDPEVSTVIRSAAGTMRQRAANAGVTAGDITGMISTLSKDIGKGGHEGRTAERAVAHLHDMLDQMAPDAGAAARRMSDAYAARSRMLEGMKEGSQTRLRNDVYPESNAAARKIENAYDTPEGTSGRAVGQANRIVTDLGGSPEEALRATVKQSRGSTGRQLEQNIGGSEAEQLVAAANAQDESAQALASASQKAQSGSGDGADAEMLVQAIAGLHPSSFITTKAGAVRRLLDLTYIPQSKARTIVDMIFSQDPAMMRRALRAVGNEPNGAAFMKYLAGVTGATAARAGGAPDIPGDFSQADDTPSAEADLAGTEEAPAADEEAPAVADDDSPYAQDLQAVYDNESPELIDLIQRVKHQESRGDQSAVSPAGAIGVMQVMPDTGPEAAALAGVPWDEEAFHSDASYNELLGIAYLSELLRKYDGDVARALAAYNAGPGATDHALASGGQNWLAALPAETQDYVARVG